MSLAESLLAVLPHLHLWRPLPHSKPDKGPRVQFAVFVENGSKIQLFSACTKEIKYVAISHVWGQIEWRSVHCIDGDILTSARKAKFIDEKLYGLVGSVPFWMDTITVNQRDKGEVIATVQAIPDIFRDAEKTIAVREGDGMYNCCALATEGFKNYGDMGRLLIKHVNEHHIQSVYDESYLKRLWTLQECLLSHTIEFVVATDGATENDEKDRLKENSYYYVEEATRLGDALFTLAQAFTHDRIKKDTRELTEFMRTYIKGGIVSRPKPPPRRHDEDIFSNGFVGYNVSSMRSATEPRDYIFATMPQFPWYHYPNDAEKMLFNDIYADFHRQASAAGQGFLSRITESMTTPGVTGGDAWLPSKQQPEPKALGDFFKLLGHPLDEPPNGQASPIHFANKARISLIDFAESEPINDLVKIMENSMIWSGWVWALSHRGGEISKLGASPTGFGKISTYQHMLRGIGGLPGVADRRGPAFRKAIEDSIEKERQHRSTHEWIFPQAMKIVDCIFCTVDRWQENRVMEAEWRDFQYEVSRADAEDQWPSALREAMVLITAMVSCQIPISAYEWAKERFVPVLATLHDGPQLLGLVAKHWSLDSSVNLSQRLWVVGRHVDRNTRGKGLVLVDSRSKVPVGLLPDFASEVQTRDEFVKQMSVLYGPLAVHIDGGRATGYKHVPVHAVMDFE